jgi:hypothetical protein
MVKAYVIGGILAALVALWLVRGILQAGAARQEAIAHKIEIRRTNPIIHGKWRDRKKAATSAGRTFAEPEPVEAETIEIKLGEALEIEPGITIILD